MFIVTLGWEMTIDYKDAEGLALKTTHAKHQRATDL